MLILLLSTAYAWDDHFLVTDGALRRPDVALPTEPVAVEPIEAFLATPGLGDLLSGYDAWLDHLGETRRRSIPLAGPTVDAFLASARLNPSTRFSYVRRLLPDEPVPADVLAITDVSPVLVPVPPLRLDYVAAPAEMTPHDVLVTYADEPDWGMDRDLFAIPAYGYGEEPYGDPTGDGSIAAFHMTFHHENGLVRAFAKPVTQGMTPEREELCVRLSRFAFATGHPYWGWRFAAWGLHYVQDLSQSYHAKALPSVGAGYYWRYVVSPAKDRMQRKATQWASNRHGLYEDYVAWTLERGYADGDATGLAMREHLVAGDATWAAEDALTLAEDVMATSAAHARTVDVAVVRAFGPKRTKDPSYDLDADPSYRIDRVDVSPADGDDLIDAAELDFENAGRATRNVIALVTAP